MWRKKDKQYSHLLYELRSSWSSVLVQKGFYVSVGAQTRNYRVKIFVLSMTVDIDLDGTTDGRFLSYFLSFY